MKDISIDTKDTFIQNQLCSYINNKIIMADSINKVDPGLQKGSQFDSSWALGWSDDSINRSTCYKEEEAVWHSEIPRHSRMSVLSMPREYHHPTGR